MKLITCQNCGSREMQTLNGCRICAYCGSKFVTDVQTSTIDLNDDVQRLLQKCRTEPSKARRYANLILDIDPSNKEALKYL